VILLAGDAGGVAATANGSFLLAIPIAALAGLVSFASPCVLPLVPGYLSYVTGLSGAELEVDGADPAPRPWIRRYGRVLAGSVLFVVGFSVLFVSLGALFGHLGKQLLVHEIGVDRGLGVMTIVLGLAFLGVVPGLQREARIHRLPAVGLAGAPVLGVIFGLGWTPCTGPTLGAVLTLAYNGATGTRGALLAFVYCLGLGLPFIVAGLAFRRALRAFRFVRRHAGWVVRVGGGLLVVLGVLLVTGAWADVSRWMLRLYPGFTTSI